MTGRAPVIAVSGASGYVGGVIAAQLAAEGARVVAVSRRPGGGQEVVSGALEAPPRPGDFAASGVEAFVHCAWDFGLRRPAEIDRVCAAGSIAHLEAAHAAGVRRLVFVSTISAFNGCRSHYGRAKLVVERRALELGAAVVRPGLVVGAAPGGMVGTLAALARRLPVVPMIGGGRDPLYMVREDDLARLCAAFALGREAPPPVPVAAAWPEPADLRAIVGALAAAHGKSPLMLGVPAAAVRHAIAFAERVSPRFPLRSDSVTGLVNPDPAPPFDRVLLTCWGFGPVLFRRSPDDPP